MSIETSCLSRKIRLGSRTVYLRPPTVRQTAQILYVLKHNSGRQDIELLFELLADLDWNGSSDILVHIRNQMISTPDEFQQFIRDILLQGYEIKESDKKDSDESGPKEINWQKLTSDYCRAYPGRDPWQVYNETPFPFFMEMLPEARREQARQKFNAAICSSFAMGGSKDLLNDWQEQGWPGKEEPVSEFNKQVDETEIAYNRKAFKEGLR